jgi:hypothetical protein
MPSANFLLQDIHSTEKEAGRKVARIQAQRFLELGFGCVTFADTPALGRSVHHQRAIHLRNSGFELRRRVAPRGRFLPKRNRVVSQGVVWRRFDHVLKRGDRLLIIMHKNISTPKQ